MCNCMHVERTFALILTEPPPGPAEVETIPHPTHYRCCPNCGELAIQRADASWQILRAGRAV